MRPKFSFLLWILFIASFLFFIIRSSIAQDPDFGWHIRFGSIMLSTGTIPKTDLFSYTMPSYHFVDHEWGTDVIMARIYQTFGEWPLIVVFALIGAGTLVLLTKGTDKRWVGIPLFLVAGTLFEFIGVRPQVITWALLALLLSLFWDQKVWQRWRFLVPLLFLFWANLHGGFVAGIGILVILLVGLAIEKHQYDYQDFIVLLVSIIATIINPYGYHLWIEIVKSPLDPVLRSTIQEWYPAIYFTNIAFWVYLMLSVFLLIRYRKHFSITVLVVYLLLLVSGLSSMRNIPLFVIFSFYPTMQALSYLHHEASKHAYGIERYAKAYVGFNLLCLFLFLPQLGTFLYGTYILHEGQDAYPKGAVTYLHEYMPEKQIFSSYDWGGYLIWQLPEKKVFIDGRMPSWRNPAAPSGESTYAFGEYRAVLQQKEAFLTLANKYGIDTVLVSPSDLQEQKVTIFGYDLTKSEFLKKFFRSNLSFAPIVREIKQHGWQEVYHDKTAVIFQKPGSVHENRGS